MPVQSRGFFACLYCGLQLDTLEEAREHESQCSHRPPGGTVAASSAASRSQQPQYPQHHQHHHPPGGATGMGPLSAADLVVPGGPYPPPSQSNPYQTYHALAGLSAAAAAAASSSGVGGGGTTSGPADASSSSSRSRLGLPPSSSSFSEVESRGGGGGGPPPPQHHHHPRLAYERMGPPSVPHHGGGGPPPMDHRMMMGFPPPYHGAGAERGRPGGDRRAGPPGSGGMLTIPGGDSAIAPTPVQRRRDRPNSSSNTMDPMMAAAGAGAPPPPGSQHASTPSSMMGYPTPYSSQQQQHRPPPGSEYGTATSSSHHSGDRERGGGGQPQQHGDNIPTPSQPNFDGERGGGHQQQQLQQEGPQPSGGGLDGSPSSSYQQYDLPSNFPYYQERDRTWHCKFCASIPPHFRDPQSIWAHPSGGPPPGNVIDYHLRICRAYQQGYPPSPPPPPSSSSQGITTTGGGPQLPPHGFNMPPPYGIVPISVPPHMQSPYGPPLSHGMGGWDTPHPQQLQYPPPSHSGAFMDGGYYGSGGGHVPHMGHSPHLMMESGGGSGRGGYPSSSGQPQEDPSDDYGEQQQQRSDHGSDRSDTIHPAQASHQRRGGSGAHHAIMVGMDPRGGGSSSMPVGRGGGAEISPDSMIHAVSYLSQFEKEYYSRDAEHSAIPRLVLDEDRLLLTDYFFFLMKQLRLCRFSEADRKTRGGKREKIKIGYGGLQCIHCSDLPMSRKFFWSNVDRLANSFAEIPGHVLKCRRCPQQNKDALLQLKQAHPEQMAKLPRGSQKVFFRRMWRRLHDEDPQGMEDDDDEDEDGVIRGRDGGGGPDNDGREGESYRPPPISTGASRSAANSATTSPDKATSPESKKSHDNSPSSGSNTITSDDSILVMQRSAKEAARALAGTPPQGQPSPSSRILLAIPEDKEWLSDMDCYIRRQLEVFCATEEDVAAAQADRKYPINVGQVGIRCIHCSIAQGNDAIGHAIAYPFSISGIYESVREFHRLHLDSCENLPSASRTKLANLKGASSLSSVLRKYYVLAAKALGLQDTKGGIRSGAESAPIGSQAAFTFAETATPADGDTIPIKKEDDEEEIVDNDDDDDDNERKLPPPGTKGNTTTGKSTATAFTMTTGGTKVKEEDFAESSSIKQEDSRVGKRSDPPCSTDASSKESNESKRFRTTASSSGEDK